MTTRRSLAVLVLVLGLGLVGAGPATAVTLAQDDIPEQCRTIVGCADAGPKPEHPGDRGGYAQLLTLAVLVGGVGFVMTKVIRAARDAQADRPG